MPGALAASAQQEATTTPPAKHGFPGVLLGWVLGGVFLVFILKG